MKRKLKIKPNITKLPNKIHFEIQKTTKANIFKDKTKYTRKIKHRKGKNE